MNNLGKILRKCQKCGNYTLKQDKCPYCGGPLRSPCPPKFSPLDPYGEYRRKLKRELAKEKEVRV